MSYRLTQWHYLSRELYKASAKANSQRLFRAMSTSSAHHQRLTQLRGLFSKHDIGYYIILTQDEHQSEYTHPCDDRRAFISGFTGSAGTAVVGLDKAVLATDGRYFLQAGKELDSNHWELLKQGVKGVPSWQEWVATEATNSGKNIGVDPKLIGYAEVESIKKLLVKKGDKAHLISIQSNLVDQVWGSDQPQRPKQCIKILDQAHAGKTFKEKLANLQEDIKQKNGTSFFVSALDEVAWLFNLRGSDIPYNPVFFAYAVVGLDNTTLFIDGDKIPEDVAAELRDMKVEVRPYEDAFPAAERLSQSLIKTNEKEESPKKLLVPLPASWAAVEALGGLSNIERIQSPIENAKAVKNPMELLGAKTAHIRDGVAIIRYLAWLENAVANEGKVMSDHEASEQCTKFREEMENFQGLSFGTISSSGPMAAVIHYHPEEGSKEMVRKDQIYLLDSGGQYLEGTTDTTRTVHFGTPSKEEINAYTLVLKGHVALARAVFPEGSNGYMLDTFARQFLWKEGLDYRHGTGHGIGAYLNVHEGPIGIGFRAAYLQQPLQVGNLISNEPGYYEDGKFGIRIESVVAVKEATTKHNFGGTKFFDFDTITQVPFCRRLIDETMLDNGEKQWINEYHQTVYSTVEDYVKKDQLAFEWLKRETQPIH